MPRDSGGNYTLPAGNPVVSGTTIDATWANPTMSDLQVALTDSLSRSGDGGMLVPFLNADGTVTLPGISWINQPNMGVYRFGLDEMRVTVGGVDKARFTGNATNPVDVFVAAAFHPLMNPTGDYDLTGTLKFETDKLKILGNIVTASPPTTEAITCRILLRDSDDTDPIGQWGFLGSNTLQFQNLMRGGSINVVGESSGGVSRNVYSGSPDGAASGYFAGVQTYRSKTAATGGFEVNNTLTGVGFERVLTAPGDVDNVTLVGTPDYITISGQVITRGLINLTTDVSGDLPIAEGGTAASTAAAARTNLDVSITSHTHTGSTISGLDTSDTTTGVFVDARIPSLNASKINAGIFPLARGGTNASSASAARTQLVVPLSSNNFVAGVGLSGGGTLNAGRTFDLDISALSTMTIADTTQNDSLLVNDGGVMKQMQIDNMGIRVVAQVGSFTLSFGNANTYLVNGGTVTDTITIPTNASVPWAIGTVIMFASSWIAETILSPAVGVNIGSTFAVGSNADRTVLSGGTAAIVKIGTDGWAVFGDIR